MLRKIRLLIASVAVFAFAANSAPAATRHHKHEHCRVGYVRHVTHKRVRRHGRIVRVRRVLCVPVAKLKLPTEKSSPSGTVITPSGPVMVHYVAKLDPTFTQAPRNALAVTYNYSADAVASNGTSLAAQGQLPPGVLNLYTALSPGQPSGLICSMNVGGSVSGGPCSANYQNTGTYQVTTEYIPNSGTASPATQTDTEAISPYSTTTSVSSHYAPAPFPNNGTLTTSYDVTGQGQALSVSSGSLTTTISDSSTGQTVTWTVGENQDCAWYVDISQNQVQFQPQPSSSCGSQPSPWFPLADFNAGRVVVGATYAGAPGWSASTSAPVGTNA